MLNTICTNRSPAEALGFQHGEAGRPHAVEDRLQRGGIEVFLALEVVVEQCLVDAGFLGNLLGARPGQPVFAELPDSGVEDAGAGLVGALGLGAGWGWW